MKKNTKLVLIIIFSLLIIIPLIKIIMWSFDNEKSKEIKEETISNVGVVKNTLYVDFDNLKNTNSDTVGYIEVPNTAIKYVVVKSTDNQYYLHHDFYKNENSTGWIFADYRNKFDGKDKNIIIYGHNMKTENAFGTLENVLSPDWYMNEDNLYIPLVIEKENMMFKVFSIYTIQAEDYYVETEFHNNEFFSFVNIIRERSIYDFGMRLGKDDTILTLSTCADNKGGRIVLHAVRIS